MTPDAVRKGAHSLRLLDAMTGGCSDRVWHVADVISRLFVGELSVEIPELGAC